MQLAIGQEKVMVVTRAMCMLNVLTTDIQSVEQVSNVKDKTQFASTCIQYLPATPKTMKSIDFHSKDAVFSTSNNNSSTLMRVFLWGCRNFLPPTYTTPMNWLRKSKDIALNVFHTLLLCLMSFGCQHHHECPRKNQIAVFWVVKEAP